MRGVSTQVQIIVVSVNYRTTPIELREKLSFRQDELEEAMRVFQQQQGVVENVILSTCNRTEVYAVLESAAVGLYSLKQFLADWFSVSIDAFRNHLMIYENDEAIEHLLRVSAGVDSMVIGETQILGQVRYSFLCGQSIGTTGTVFNQLFKEAITFSKKAHAETNIGENTVSISYAAVQLLKQAVGDLSELEVIVLGAGEMGELTLKNLKGNGLQKVTIVNRTFSTAKEMATKYGVQAKPIEELQQALATSTIVISSTAAREPVIELDCIQEVMKNRQESPLYLVDIAVPRDIDASVSEIPAVYLYDIDDIQKIIDANLVEREKIAKEIEAKIEQQVILFNEWLATLQVVPVINALQEKGVQIQQKTLESMYNKMPGLTEREKKVLQKHTQSIVNQLMRDPIREVKELAFMINNKEKINAFEKTFGIEQDVEVNQEKAMAAKLAKERLHR